jgi:hypothetical protein
MTGIRVVQCADIRRVGQKKHAYEILARKSAASIPRGRPSSRRQNYNKTQDNDWIQLVQDN